MRLKYLAKNSKHFSCKGVNLCAGEIGEFEDSLAQLLMKNFPEDFEALDAPVEEKSAEHMPKENKMAKKTAKFKSKQA